MKTQKLIIENEQLKLQIQDLEFNNQNQKRSNNYDLNKKIRKFFKALIIIRDQIIDIKQQIFEDQEVFENYIKTDVRQYIENMIVQNQNEAIDQFNCDQCENLLQEINYYKNQYIVEYNKRKQLFNQIQDMKGNIRVLCRLKPINKVEDNCISLFNNSELTITNQQKQNKYEFNEIFDQNQTQQDIFCQIKYLIESFVDGYNVCIFAYGQTGSGKTYTMHGPKHDRGVFYRSIRINYLNQDEIFSIKEQRQQNFDFDIKISMFEIYNDNILDLLETTNKKCEIRQGQNRNYVQNLKVHQVTTIEQVKLIQEDNQIYGIWNLKQINQCYKLK